jgi:soluble lytic murein transglycosylase-like protein
LDPEKNIRAGIKILKSKNSNNPLRAFTAYNGSGPAAQRYGREVTGIYNTCCKANEGDPQKKCEGRLTN